MAEKLVVQLKRVQKLDPKYQKIMKTYSGPAIASTAKFTRFVLDISRVTVGGPLAECKCQCSLTSSCGGGGGGGG